MTNVDRVAQISARLAAVQMETPPVSVNAAWNALEIFAPSDLAWLLKERTALLRLLDDERARADALSSALQRTEANFRTAVNGRPVRDMAENLAENEAALNR